MEKINNNLYTLFIDESGVASLNHRGKVFILSCVIIKNSDIPIIQGYFQLLKREYFRNECKGIHCTDLFERTYKKYRKLMVPQDRRNSFLTRIEDTLKIVPFQSAIYYIDKDKLRNKIGYKPYGGKKSTTINYDLPYELVSRNALIDFSCFLASKKSSGMTFCPVTSKNSSSMAARILGRGVALPVHQLLKAANDTPNLWASWVWVIPKAFWIIWSFWRMVMEIWS